MISRLEAGKEVPSVEAIAKIASGLGADLSIRIFPNTGPALRDRHQARIAEALVRLVGDHWAPIPEVGVRSPVRGWIDVVLVHMARAVIVAAEIESMPRRLEQILRWSAAKADALPSASSYPFGVVGGEPSVHRLLVLRETAANRELAAAFAGTLKAAYPGDPWQARAALAGQSQWPGHAILWAAERRDRAFEIAAVASGKAGAGGR